MKTLYLCEKPSQARTLAKVLGAHSKIDGAYEGNNVYVTYCHGSMHGLADPGHYLGHAEWQMEDLPILPKKWEIVPRYSAMDQLALIGELLKSSSRAVIATDPDDAGEVIGRWVLESHRYKGEIKRLWASALDHNSITNGIKNLRDISETEAYYRAGLAQFKMDWSLGMNLTRFFSIKGGVTRKIGRVKTRLLVDIAKREKDISKFVASYLYSASFRLGDSSFEWIQNGSDHPVDFGATAKCVSVVDDVVDMPPPSPFTLSSLLCAMANDGFSLAQAYAATQSLYEKGFISYPRTSSDHLPDGRIAGFANHHAIIPVASAGTYSMESFDNAEKGVYQKVSRNYNQNLVGSASLHRRLTIMEVNGHLFSHADMWLDCDESAGWLLFSQNDLDKYYGKTPAKKIAIGNNNPVVTKVVATPSVAPSKYSEATLLKAMMDNNIGTEATRVKAIGSLIEDGVVTLNNGVFSVTSKGRELIAALPDSVKGSDMSTMVSHAVLEARLSGDSLNNHLQKVFDWLSDIISESATTVAG